MKKFLLVLFAACLAVSSFGAYQYNAGNYYGIPTGSFSFTSDMSVKMNVDMSSLKGFGYYYLSDNTVQIAGDMTTGLLGNFKTGDSIGIWMQAHDGYIYTTTRNPFDQFVAAQAIGGDRFLLYSGPSVGVGRDSWEYALSDASKTTGQPLPGILATLLLGGGVTAGFQFRKRANKK